MWRYEVAYYDADGLYRWKGFGKVDKFERFLKSLKRKGCKIVNLINMDGPEEKKRFMETYIG